MQKELFDLISESSTNSNILAIPVILIDYCEGDLQAAMLLSQLIYWTDKTKDGWIYKTYSEWYNEIRLSEYQTRRAKKKLEKMGVLKTKIKKANGNPTVHYKIVKQQFLDSIIKILQKHSLEKLSFETCNSSESLTEITTKTTHKTTSLYNHNERALVNKKEKKDSVEEIYKLYPAQCPVNHRPTFKTYNDKLKIKKIIDSGYPLKRIISMYVEYCKHKRRYLKNLKTFLNNLPTPEQAKKIYHIENDDERLKRIMKQNNWGQ